MAATKGNQIVTSVYLDTDQYRALQKLSNSSGAPMAHWIRKGVNKVLAENGWPGIDPTPMPVRQKAKRSK
jgi:hypothetical protein